MLKNILSSIFFLLISHYAYSDPITTTKVAAQVYSNCRATYAKEITSFEKKHDFSFYSAVETSINKQIQKDFVEKKPLNRFCMGVIGNSYGKVSFVSNPTGATIYIGGVVRSNTTNTVLVFTPGEYPYRLDLNKKKLCAGYVNVTENQTTPVICNQL